MVVQFDKTRLSKAGESLRGSNDGIKILNELTKGDLIVGQILSSNCNGDMISSNGVAISTPFDMIMHKDDTKVNFFDTENIETRQTSVVVFDFTKIKSVEQIEADRFATWGSYALLITFEIDATYVIAFDFK